MVDKLPLPVSLNWWTPDSFHQWYRDCIKPPRMTMTTLHWSRPRPRTLQRRGLVNHHDPTKHFRPFFWGVQTVVFFGGGVLKWCDEWPKCHHLLTKQLVLMVWKWCTPFFGSPNKRNCERESAILAIGKNAAEGNCPLTMQKCHSPDVFSKTGSVQTPEILVYVKRRWEHATRVSSCKRSANTTSVTIAIQKVKIALKKMANQTNWFIIHVTMSSWFTIPILIISRGEYCIPES